MNRNLLRPFGLKWNPFSEDIPTSSLWRNPRVSVFSRRIEQMTQEGGFAAILGEPGLGKSADLRALAENLAALPGVTVGVLTHAQASLSDFYREMGHIFGVSLSPSNRWGGFTALRERWQTHIEATLHRPVLLIDEAQLVRTKVFSELRLLASAQLDSRIILTVILAGDQHLVNRLQTTELLPLWSRLRARLSLEPLSREELIELLEHTMEEAGNPNLMTRDLLETLVDHSNGNPRAMMQMAQNLLVAAHQKEQTQLDEALYLELTGRTPRKSSRSRPRKEDSR